MKKYTLPIFLAVFGVSTAFSQTDMDGIMMAKNNLCTGPMLGASSWKKYWEGNLLRTNENLGTVSGRTVSVMGNYGITDDLNVLFMLPWIKNQASAGTLHSMQGIQDLSLLAKYRFFYRNVKSFHFSGIGLLGVSTPLTNYVADYLPLSIGMHSTNVSGRVMLDVEKNNFYGTVSYAFIERSNITIDRNSYYTTELIQSNQVEMPSMGNTNLRLGYRKGELVIEAVGDMMNTYGGFDIRRNDMPFPSNNMDAFRAGINFKLPIPKLNGLSLTGNSMYTLSGRNMGKSWMNNIGFFYLMDLTKKGGDK